MSTTDDPIGGHAPDARGIRARFPGLVWAVPLAALLIVAYLGIRAVAHRGVDVFVTFPSAAGVSVGDTKVMYRGVEAGHVTRIRIAPDAKSVELKLRLDPRARAVLNSNTRFWLVGAKPSLSDIQSVKAALAGLTIGIEPGTGGMPTRRFTGLEYAPVVTAGTPGTPYLLRADDLGPVQRGASVVSHGQEIGKVTATAPEGLRAFRIRVFIFRPFDRYVRPGAQFWTGSPLKFSLSKGGVRTSLTPSTLLQGSIQFELPEDAAPAAQAPAGALFPLYDTQEDADNGPTGPAVRYEVRLPGSAGDLERGSPMRYLGYKVGEVVSAKLHNRMGRPAYTRAVVRVFPRLLGVALPDAAPAGAWRTAGDRTMADLLGRGYAVAMTQAPPLIGSHVLTLALSRRRTAPGLAAGEAFPLLPAVPAGPDGDDLMAKADSILGKLDRVPLVEIGRHVRGITAHLDAVTGSPDLRNSIARLNGTLAEVTATMREVRPRVGPLLAKLDRTADQLQATAGAARATLSGEGAAQDAGLPDAIRQLTEAGRSIRALTDYLGQHPEAILRGKGKAK